MICISIAQESRRLALVDMLNASRQCDLVEVRLDAFDKTPDVAELLAHKPRPLILSCRRVKDGGTFKGSEEERLTLLRQCIVGKADYVEIELDVADQIRKFPPAKRVITYTNLQATPDDIADIYAQAQTKSPDVIKLVTQARTPEEAWPLLQIVAKQTVPTVVVGLGKPGIMLTILGKKIGAPWTYAALEKGMETYPGQPTVRELNDVYHYAAISKTTRLIGVTGFGETAYATVAILNAAIANAGLGARCLPMGIGSLPVFKKVIDAVNLAGVVVDEEHRGTVVSVASVLEPAAEEAKAVDLLISREKVWHGYNTVSQAALSALESVMRQKAAVDRPLEGRMVMVVGANSVARAAALGITKQGGRVIIASSNKEAAQQLAQTLECRFIQLEALYTTLHDVLVICDNEKVKTRGAADSALHPGYLKPGMVVMDLTSAHGSTFLKEAKVRGCLIVEANHLLQEQIRLQAKHLLGKDVPRDVMAQTLASILPEEAE